MPRYVAKPFTVVAHQWRPGVVVEGVYALDKNLPRGLRVSRDYEPGQCAWTRVRGMPVLVEPGDMVVDLVEGRVVWKPEFFERAFSPSVEEERLQSA